MSSHAQRAGYAALAAAAGAAHASPAEAARHVRLASAQTLDYQASPCACACVCARACTARPRVCHTAGTPARSPAAIWQISPLLGTQSSAARGGAHSPSPAPKRQAAAPCELSRQRGALPHPHIATQALAKWVEQLLPFLALLAILFTYNFATSLFLLAWLGGSVHKANDVLRKIVSQAACEPSELAAALMFVATNVALTLWLTGPQQLRALALRAPPEPASAWQALFAVAVTDSLVRCCGIIPKLVIAAATMRPDAGGAPAHVRRRASSAGSVASSSGGGGGLGAEDGGGGGGIDVSGRFAAPWPAPGDLDWDEDAGGAVAWCCGGGDAGAGGLGPAARHSVDLGSCGYGAERAARASAWSPPRRASADGSLAPPYCGGGPSGTGPPAAALGARRTQSSVAAFGAAAPAAQPPAAAQAPPVAQDPCRRTTSAGAPACGGEANCPPSFAARALAAAAAHTPASYAHMRARRRARMLALYDYVQVGSRPGLYWLLWMVQSKCLGPWWRPRQLVCRANSPQVIRLSLPLAPRTSATTARSRTLLYPLLPSHSPAHPAGRLPRIAAHAHLARVPPARRAAPASAHRARGVLSRLQGARALPPRPAAAARDAARAADGRAVWTVPPQVRD